LGDLLLDDAFSGADLASSHFVEDCVTDLLDQIGSRCECFQWAAIRSRSTRCRILPVAVRGICWSSMNRTDCGRLYPACFCQFKIDQARQLNFDQGLKPVF
jgi:hypothetical protein